MNPLRVPAVPSVSLGPFPKLPFGYLGGALYLSIVMPVVTILFAVASKKPEHAIGFAVIMGGITIAGWIWLARCWQSRERSVRFLTIAFLPDQLDITATSDMGVQTRRVACAGRFTHAEIESHETRPFMGRPKMGNVVAVASNGERVPLAPRSLGGREEMERARDQLNQFFRG